MRIWYATILLLLAACLLFFRLGHYALWDDEANTALTAIGVWRTGDSTAIIDHNIIAYRNGRELKNFHIRYMPPLQYYLAAPFVGLMGNSALAARLPFAICGLACIGLMVGWIYRHRVSAMIWLIAGMAILGNVSLFLYLRNARYYAPAILCSVAIAYLYYHWNGRRRNLLLISLFSILLLASNYLNFLALYVCLAMDYVIWGRRCQRLSTMNWLLLLLPPLLIGGAIVWIWNPFQSTGSQLLNTNTLLDRVALFWWNWRDLDACEFGSVLLILISPVLFYFIRDDRLLRGPFILTIYLAIIALFTPQPLIATSVADVRYLAPAIPLCIAIAILVLQAIGRYGLGLALSIAIAAFGTNLLNVFSLRQVGLRSTIVQYMRELAAPPGDPFSIVAEWINTNLPQHATILVLPGVANYPLMFHAPKSVYAWQFQDPPQPQFQGLGPIHYVGRVAPDYIVVFGHAIQQLQELIAHPNLAGVRYQLIERVDFYGTPVYRPELFWRSFTEVRNFNPHTQGIYIFRKNPPQ